MKDININSSIWNNFTETEMENYITDVFNHYREHGFPYFPTDEHYRKGELASLMRYMSKNDVFDRERNSFKQTMHGLAFCWSYFPHSFDVKCNNKLSPIEAFNNDEMLLKVIKKRLRMGDNMSDNGLRKQLKISTGIQSVSNFRPSAIVSLIRWASNVLGRGNLTMYDPCSGYGGRLLGAHCSGLVDKYIACEPCEKTYNGLIEMCSDLNEAWKENIYMCGCEEYIPESKVDMIFTSPPYFDTEHYSDESTQSYIKFPTKELWLEGFLSKMIDNCYSCLKDDGIFMLNIANVPSYKNIEEDFLKIMLNKSDKWERKDDLYLALSSLSRDMVYKYEPIFVFRKKISESSAITL